MSVFKISTKHLGLSALAIILTAGTALAAQDGASHLDTDGNKELSKAEFLAGATARFDAADVNRDDFLSTDEQKAQRESQRDKREDRKFSNTDLNKDGQISKEEFDTALSARDEKKKARRDKVKSKLDLNGDGQVDQEERASFKDKRKASKEERKAKKGARKSSSNQRFQRPDANQDGFVSRDEHMAAAERMFTLLDADSDGVLSQGEGKKRHKRRKGRKKRG